MTSEQAEAFGIISGGQATYEALVGSAPSLTTRAKLDHGQRVTESRGAAPISRALHQSRSTVPTLPGPRDVHASSDF